MENEQRKYWFFGSKLNTGLLLVLIVLMIIALRIMLQNKEIYFGTLQEDISKNETSYSLDTKEDTKVSILKAVFLKSNNPQKIIECNYEDKSYFGVIPSAIDFGQSFYEADTGKSFLTCGAYSLEQEEEDLRCQSIMQSCNVIYQKQSTRTGVAKIDVYNISD